MGNNINNIRNFVIIAHIDHGKSTLADRLLELTNTVEKRKMKEQVLDQMELERERGITIKMQPVRMSYILNSKSYILNLIDTPGHIDFSYEVSRALKAVEGAILLVDATQGVQAQTITNVEMAKSLNLVIIPIINKIDLPSARVKETKEEIMRLLKTEDLALRLNFQDILCVSAKTGQGIEKIFKEVICCVPAPKYEIKNGLRALVFDFEYSNHQGVILYVRIVDGKIKKGDKLFLSQARENFTVGEMGIFSPSKKSIESLMAGEIGYIVTNIKNPSIGVVGDSVVSLENSLPALSGYMQPKPVVWASIYPESNEDFSELKQALERLRLSDSSLVFEEESSGALGRGFRCGFLGMLHLEIITERLKREFNLNLITASPTITYKVIVTDNIEKEIYSPVFFPDDNKIKKVFEPWVDIQIITPPSKLGSIMKILHEYEVEIGETEQFGDYRAILNIKMPLRELMKGFFDELKSVSSGYASLNYKISNTREILQGGITRLDIWVGEKIIPAFSRIVSKQRIQKEAEEIVEKLKKILPRALFVVKIQAKGLGKILASRSMPAIKKDVTGYLYGGDRTRKMKLWKKQKKGKKRLQEVGKVNIPHEVFIKMMQR